MSENGLRLVVENLGPIEHADVDVRPLTVLIGRNNTGKTYLAQALYAAFRTVDELQPRLIEPLTTPERATLHRVLRQKAPEENGYVSLGLRELPAGILEKTKTWMRRAFQDAGTELEGRLLAYFSEPELDRISRWDQPETVRVGLHGATDGSFYFGTGSTPAPDLSTIDTLETHWSQRTVQRYSRIFRSREEEMEEGFIDRDYSTLLLTTVWHKYLETTGLSGSAHYLPAGRSGLLNAWTDVVKLRLHLERERFGLPRMPDTSLNGVALDFIRSLADVLGGRHQRWWRWHDPRLPRPRFRSGGDRPGEPGSLQLLRELMQGRIRTGSDEDMVPTLDYEQEGNRIAVRRASSMVADLAPLAMWMDRIIQPDDLLIIDEPESHLHPEAIRLVARVLVRLVNEGVKVVCATHSSVLLHELSNCILRDQPSIKASGALGPGYTESDILPMKRIAVHLFHRPDTTEPVKVTCVPVEADWGIPEDEYVGVASEMSDETARLIDLLG